MKVVAPTRLLSAAAEVLEPFRDQVVVVGAAALEVALVGVASVATTATRDVDLVAITPTRDVDIVVPVDRASDIVGHLEAVGMRRSEVPHERAFTWIRGDLKVQLVRTFHPFPKPPARSLPSNPVFGMATEPGNQVVIAFDDDPSAVRLVCANAACLLALKQAAFGRTRAPDDAPVERDFHDAYLLISAVPDVLVAEFVVASYEVRQRASDAVAQLASGGHATQTAARQMVRLRAARTQRQAEAAVRRSAVRIQQRVADA